MVAKKEWNTQAQLALLKSFGYKGDTAGSGEGKAFLRANPNILAQYEAARKQYAGQENYSTDFIKQTALTTEEQIKVNRGGGVSTVTGQVLDAKQQQYEQNYLGATRKKLMSLKEQLGVASGAQKDLLSSQITDVESELNRKKSELQAQYNVELQPMGQTQALTADEKALRAAGYQGDFTPATSARWLELQNKETTDKFIAARATEATKQKVMTDFWKVNYGNLADFVGLGSFSDPNAATNYRGVASVSARDAALAKFGNQLSSLEPLKLAQMGFSIANIAGKAGSVLGASTGIASGINSWAASMFPELFGIGSAGETALLSQAGALTGAGTATGALSGAGTGAAIGTGYSMITGTNQLGSQVGGAIGGAVGSLVPVLGTYAGAAIGSVIGGGFGSEAHPFSTFTGTVNNKDFTYSTQNKHIADKMGSTLGASAEKFMETVQKTTGIDLSGLGMMGGFAQDKYYIRTAYTRGANNDIAAVNRNEMTFNINPADPTSIVRAYANIAVDYMSKTNSEINDLVNKGVGAEDILGALQARYAKGAAKGGNDNTKPVTPTKTPVIEPILPTDTVETKIHKQATIMQTQVNDFLERVSKGKTGITGTIHTSARGLLDNAPTIKARIISGR